MSEWQEVKLKDVLNFYNGKTIDYTKGGEYPVFGSNGQVGLSSKYKYENVIILGRVGAYCGAVFYIKEKCWATDNTIVVKAKNNTDINFLYYLLNILNLNNFAGGSAQPLLTQGWLKPIKINLPPLPTQHKIAKILSNYDDLIENNLKRIKLLEESARLTYEEWFLRFRIDGKKLEIDPETKLPFGWKWKLLKDFGEVVTGKTPSTNNEDFYGGYIPFVKTPSMHGHTYALETEEYLTDLGANTQQNKFLPKNSLMVSCIGTAGVYSLVANDCQTNQQINSIKFHKDEYIFYVYGFAGHLSNILDAIGSNGATMTNVNKTKFENIEVAMPSSELLERFHNTFSPNFESILNIMRQNQLLKEARDILLPRLMTNVIDTNDMDIAI